MTNDLLQEGIHRKETKTWQHIYSTLVTNIHNERKTFFSSQAKLNCHFYLIEKYKIM